MIFVYKMLKIASKIGRSLTHFARAGGGARKMCEARTIRRSVFTAFNEFVNPIVCIRKPSAQPALGKTSFIPELFPDEAVFTFHSTGLDKRSLIPSRIDKFTSTSLCPGPPATNMILIGRWLS